MGDHSIGGVETVVDADRLEDLGRLAGGVAHDYNNLLGVISNYAAFVADAIEISLKSNDVAALEGALDDVHQIAAAAERAALRTRQLLAFARRRHAHVREIDLNCIVAEAVHQAPRRSDVLMHTSLATGVPLVTADPVQLDEVIDCLITNALEAMPHGGEIVVTTRLGPDRMGGAEVRVSDTGIGMTEKVKCRAFEPFFTTKGLGGGVGLGLATVHGIVARAGGSVSIDSTRGAGTTVTVWLPDCAHAAATG